MVDEDDDGALSPSMLVPLSIPKPRDCGAVHSSGKRRHDLMACYPSTPASASAAIIAATTSHFAIPEGWEVEEVPRADHSRIDKYYYEPETGQRFRSLKEVERYLTGEEYTPSRKSLKQHRYSRNSRPRKMIISGGRLLKLDEGSDQGQLAILGPAIAAATSPFRLPNGWVVEEVPRKCYGQIDKNSGSWKKISGEIRNGSASNSAKPHVKINWVLADPGGGKWNAFIGESMVPESVRQEWVDEFTSWINGMTCTNIQS